MMVQRKRAVVAMSGGVDSSVAAALLMEQGYDVIGLMLRLWREPGEGVHNRCCTPQHVEEARRVAQVLGIPFHRVDAERRFKKHVVDTFIREHARGRTPNPCLACNKRIKFGFLLRTADAAGADYVATGHYARVRRRGRGYDLIRASDSRKDQSYFLFMLNQRQLRRTLFPVGGYTKPQVRALARDKRLPVAAKQESQDICFARDQDYGRFLRAHAPHTLRPGPVLDRSGRELGEHEGLPLYTIGQRRGIGITWPEPLYVLDKDVPNNSLIVGPAYQLGRRRFFVEEPSYVTGQAPSLPASVAVKVRSTGREAPATLYPGESGLLEVRLTRCLRDITPGQGAVFYRGDVVVGGGIIARAG
ncbi:MAG: tRNA 2-thiouridine(34) synthase MnmA [Anaerolineae bacterium]|jgi:tRNA-specific 2-thiouridylase